MEKNQNKNKKLSVVIFLIVSISGIFVFLFAVQAKEDRDHLLISEIAIYKKNDWIKLYNPTEKDVNLEKEEYRIERATKSKENPTYYLKFGKESHGAFPGGVIIEAKGSYVVVDEDADEEIKEEADAIIKSSRGFALTDDNIVYLGKGAISSSEDEDIVDFVGYGKASQFEGNAPAPDPQEKGIIRKKIEDKFVDEDDNGEDFVLNNSNDNQASSDSKDEEDSSEKDASNDLGENEDEEKIKEFDFSNNLYISEMLPSPKGSDSKNEFIEVFNFDDKQINLKGWFIEDDGKQKEIKDNFLIMPDSRAVIYRDQVSFSLNNNGNTISLLAPNEQIISRISYEDAEEGMSLSFDGYSWQWTQIPTPGRENMFEARESEIENGSEEVTKNYKHNVRLSEILPAPEKGEEEYIEIYNFSSSKANLTGWKLTDLSNREYEFPENYIVLSEQYKVIKRKDFGFAMNNSGGEEIFLLDPSGAIASSVYYEKSAKGASFNFSKEKWRWSRFLTPGKENIFNSLPEVDLDIDEDVYPGMYVNFAADVEDDDGDDINVKWDFGDGKYSYLSEARHKYSEKGTYKGSVTVSDGSEKVVKDFKVKVKEYPDYDVEFVAFVPNPVGKDSVNEWIEVKNNEDKKVDLDGWSVATGWGGMLNHVISGKVEVFPGETQRITRENSKFNLNNKRLKIQLRYPNGSVADEIQYERKKSFSEGAVYRKMGGNWVWTGMNIESGSNEKIDAKADNDSSIIETKKVKKKSKLNSGRYVYIPNKYTSIDDSTQKELIGYGLSYKIKEITRGEKVKIKERSHIIQSGKKYFFNQPKPTEAHYFVKFIGNLKLKLNNWLSKIFS